MRCQDAFVMMSAALDGELDAAESSSLEQHLAACESCRASRQQLAALDGRLRAPARRPALVPEDLRARIANRLARASSPSRRRASPLAFALAFTGAAAAAAALAMATPAPGSGAAALSGPEGDKDGDNDSDGDQPLPPPSPAFTSGRVRLRGHDSCRVAVAGASPVARACSSGGTREASRVMRTLVNAARRRGLRLDCRDCHRNLGTFDLDDGARDRFARMLAMVGA